MQIYMILRANGMERGEPIGYYTDVFKARADFATISDVGSRWTASLTAFLVAYKVQKGRAIIELQELGRK